VTSTCLRRWSRELREKVKALELGVDAFLQLKEQLGSHSGFGHYEKSTLTSFSRCFLVHRFSLFSHPSPTKRSSSSATAHFFFSLQYSQNFTTRKSSPQRPAAVCVDQQPQLLSFVPHPPGVLVLYE